MDYERWRSDVFGQAPECEPYQVQLLDETYQLSTLETFDHIDRSLIDQEIHGFFTKQQIGIGLNLIYSNSLSSMPSCYVEAGDDERRVTGISNLRNLYTEFFQRYCSNRVHSIGNNTADGHIGYICYMLWDIFILYPGNASPDMVAAALQVMRDALRSANENCIVSAIHGLGHWVYEVPEAGQILTDWLENPATHNHALLNYARDAVSGSIL